jgi:hypothetical protein
MSGPLLLAGRLEQLGREVHYERSRHFRRLLEECERYRSVPLPAEHPAASNRTTNGRRSLSMASGTCRVTVRG